MTTFQHNLKTLSVKTGDSYLDEWIIEGLDKSNSFEDRCICSRKIKHKYIVRNILNGNFVQVGTSCIKKLTDPAGNILQVTKKSINQCITDSFNKGVFVPIKDLHQYSIDVITQYLLENTPEKIYEMYELYKSNRKVRRVICDIKNKRFCGYWDGRSYNFSKSQYINIRKIWLDTICPKNINFKTPPTFSHIDEELHINMMNSHECHESNNIEEIGEIKCDESNNIEEIGENKCHSCGCITFDHRDTIPFQGDYHDGNVNNGIHLVIFCNDCMEFYDINDEEKIASKRLINNIIFELECITYAS